jgi:hypothetical protein
MGSSKKSDVEEVNQLIEAGISNKERKEQLKAALEIK